jgi:hypothetical protein
MWFPAVIYCLVSILLWYFAKAFFMPQVLTDLVFPVQDTDLLVYRVALANIAFVYFGAYWVFAANWKRLQPYLRNEFLGGVTLWAINVFIIFPLIGRGVFGYKLPQGALFPCLYLFGTHWMYARMLEMKNER